MIPLKSVERFFRTKVARHSAYIPHAVVIVILLFLMLTSVEDGWDDEMSQISEIKEDGGSRMEEIIIEKPTATSTTTTTVTTTTTTTVTTTTDDGKCHPKVTCIDLPFAMIDNLKNGVSHPSENERTIYLKTSSKLSNILFEMGFVIALSEATCSKVKVNTVIDMSNIFAKKPFEEISEAEFNNQAQMPSFSGKDGSKVYERLLTTGLQDNMKIQGVFPIYKFFSGCLPKITERLKINDMHINEAKIHIKDVLTKNGHMDAVPVGVHILHGDDFSEYDLLHGKHVPNATYYQKAMDHITQTYNRARKHVVFIIVTDNRNFVKKHFDHSVYPDVFLTQEDNSLVVNLSILGLCDHVIQSQGTFSRWAAILSKGDSITPSAPELTEWTP